MPGPEWYLWYGMHLGLTRDEALSIPFCLLCDLIAVNQIKAEEGFRRKLRPDEEDAELDRLLSID